MAFVHIPVNATTVVSLWSQIERGLVAQGYQKDEPLLSVAIQGYDGQTLGPLEKTFPMIGIAVVEVK
jgi:hypothetical protein